MTTKTTIVRRSAASPSVVGASGWRSGRCGATTLPRVHGTGVSGSGATGALAPTGCLGSGRLAEVTTVAPQSAAQQISVPMYFRHQVPALLVDVREDAAGPHPWRPPV